MRSCNKTVLAFARHTRSRAIPAFQSLHALVHTRERLWCVCPDRDEHSVGRLKDIRGCSALVDDLHRHARHTQGTHPTQGCKIDTHATPHTRLHTHTSSSIANICILYVSTRTCNHNANGVVWRTVTCTASSCTSSNVRVPVQNGSSWPCEDANVQLMNWRHRLALPEPGSPTTTTLTRCVDGFGAGTHTIHTVVSRAALAHCYNRTQAAAYTSQLLMNGSPWYVVCVCERVGARHSWLGHTSPAAARGLA